jgi:hypothetical protein
MGIGELNNQPIKYLADTGSNRTIVNINALEPSDDKYENIKPIKGIKLVLAEGQPCQILGEKIYKIALDDAWSIKAPVIVSTQLLQNWIIGMDILTKYPGTRAIIGQLKYAIATASRNIIRRCRPDIDQLFVGAVHSLNNNTIDMSNKTPDTANERKSRKA